jgi:dTDP-4-amino-4,6-dideoxygalactose transaminase
MFAKYLNAKYAMAVSSCTAGLHLAMVASGVKAGDEVITTPMTFCASANSVIHTGAKPIFADVDRWTMNIDPMEIRKKITPSTRVILPVHLAGRPCQMDEITRVAKENNLLIVNDAAHAIETEFHGKKIHHWGDLTAYSFYVTKNVVTAEGGMVTTDHEEWADKIKIYALHGMTKDAWKRFSDEGYKHYQVVFPGFKYNLTDIQASLGLHQMKRIEKYSRRRQKIWNYYQKSFQGLPVFLPKEIEPNTRHAMHLYTLLLDIDRLNIDRDQFMDLLFHENIGSGVHYLALHLQPYYQQRFGYQRGDFPNTEFISDRTLSIPFSAKLKDGDVEDVARAVRKILSAHQK